LKPSKFSCRCACVISRVISKIIALLQTRSINLSMRKNVYAEICFTFSFLLPSTLICFSHHRNCFVDITFQNLDFIDSVVLGFNLSLLQFGRLYSIPLILTNLILTLFYYFVILTFYLVSCNYHSIAQ